MCLLGGSGRGPTLGEDRLDLGRGVVEANTGLVACAREVFGGEDLLRDR